MKKQPKKKGVKWTDNTDAAFDKRNGIKSGSEKDIALDTKRGVKTSTPADKLKRAMKKLG